MRRILTGAALVALLLPSVVSAEVVSAEHAQTVALRDGSAVVFFTDTPAGFQVVTTIAIDETSPSLRFTHDLAVGQSAVIELNGTVDTPAARLVLTREGDQLRVESSNTKSAGL